MTACSIPTFTSSTSWNSFSKTDLPLTLQCSSDVPPPKPAVLKKPKKPAELSLGRRCRRGFQALGLGLKGLGGSSGLIVRYSDRDDMHVSNRFSFCSSNDDWPCSLFTSSSTCHHRIQCRFHRGNQTDIWPE